MSKTKLRKVLAFVLAIMLLLASCQQPVADEPYEHTTTEAGQTGQAVPAHEIYQFGGGVWRTISYIDANTFLRYLPIKK